MIGLTFLAGDIAFAAVILSGFDFFETDSASTFVNLDPDGPGGLSPFSVPLEGKPFETLTGSGSLWNTDTIVERTQGLNPFSVDDTGTVDIELVALSLKSIAPVDIGGTLFDIEILSGNLFGEPSNFLGSMTINHRDPNGGTFVSILPVSAKLIFTEVGNFFNTFDQPLNRNPRIPECPNPHCSVQAISYAPVSAISNHVGISCPGTTSCFRRSTGTKKL